MKNIKLITILALSSAVLFGGKATANKAKVNFKETVVARSESSGSIADLVIDSDKAIHGLQFDISYNTSEIKSIQPEDISVSWLNIMKYLMVSFAVLSLV